MILPVEALADVVRFFEYYDLGGLKLSNKTFSSLANKHADAIRLFDFSDLSFYISGSWINVFRLDAYGEASGTLMCLLKLTSEESLASFISQAFRNCAVGRLVLGNLRMHVLHAISVVANTISIAGTLDANLRGFENGHEFIAFVSSFRRAKVRLA